MGHHEKIPIMSERRYVFHGLFDMKQIHKFLKDFLTQSRHYDWTEKDYEEKNEGGERRIWTKVEAEQEYTDYYKVIIRYELLMEGKDVIVEENGKSYKLTKGKAKLTINAYIEPDFAGRRPVNSAFADFLERVYEKHFGGDEREKCIVSTVGDISEMITRFKQTVNSALK